MKQSLRQSIYLVGHILESTNRAATILNKREPVKPKIIYSIYRVGRLLRWLR